MKIIFYILISLLLVSCKQKGNSSQEAKETTTYEVAYATGFTVAQTPEYTRVDIRDPWDTTKYLQHYILIPKDKPVPQNLPDGILVRTPLKRVIACTSVHCGLLDLLGIKEELVGVCESRYIDIDFVKQGLANGTITDIGESSAPDIEKLIELSPEAIITSPLSNAPYGRVEKTGIPQIKCVDYMEPTPLGRAEWIRLHALFFGKEAEGDSLFGETVKAYNEVKELVSHIETRPTVVTEMKSGAMWYIPGGESYMAHLLRDAGANYDFPEDTHSGSVPLSFETVLDKWGNADFWLIKYNRPEEISYAGLKNEYSPNAHFAAYKNQNIFVCNTGKVPYYEEMPIRPDYILKDLVRIFHPEVLPEHRLKYYKAMGQ